MKTFQNILLLSILIYGLAMKQNLLSLIILLIICYTILEIIIQIFFSVNTLKSKFFGSNFNETGSPCVFINFKAKIDKVEKVMKEYNEKHPDKKITLDIFCMRGLGNALNKHISYGNISLGNFTNLDYVDVTIFKNYEGKAIYDTIRKCNVKKIPELNEEIKKNKKIRIEEFDKNNKFFQNYSKYLPSFLVNFFLETLHFISYSLEINFFGYEKQKFGNAVFVPYQKGSYKKIYLPMTKRINSCVVVSMGEVMETPFYKENGEIGIERIINFSLTCDHRVGDGSALITEIPRFREVFKNPEKFM